MRWLVVVALVVAGCAVDAPQAPHAQEPEALPGPVQLAGEPVPSGHKVVGNASDWRSFELHASGEAGAWLVGYHPFATPLESLGVKISYHLSAEGSDAMVFAVPPTFVHGQGEDAFLRISPVFGGDNMQRGEDRVDFVYDMSYGSGSGAGMSGMLVAAAANVPWTLEVRVDVDEGGPLVPVRHIVTGGNATFAWGAERVLPAGGVDLLTFGSSHQTQGWTHLEVLRDPLQPLGVRQQDFRLPGGASHTGIGFIQGYDTYVLGASAGSNGFVEVFGDLHDGAGGVAAELTLVEADLDVDVASVHLPIADVPPGLGDGVYLGSKWPFRDSLPGTFVPL